MTISSAARAALALLALALARDARWLSARPDYGWSFPRDHWSHPGYRSEWWYFTGQLAAPGDTTPRLGYQFTLFRIGLVPSLPRQASAWATRDLVMGHAALTDLMTGRHLFSEALVRAVPLLGGFGEPGDSLVAWSLAPAGTPGRWTLRWTGRGFAFAMADARQGFAMNLLAEAAVPPLLEGPNGYSRKGRSETNASQYYSLPRLGTTGKLIVGAETLLVRGTSWMDKEFGSSQLDSASVGWDWFSLQLADGRDVMLYLLRDSSGASTWGGGTIAAPGRAPRYLPLGGFTVRVTNRWTSPATLARYPAAWRIDIPSERLTFDVTPLAADQENRSRIATRLFYWEGAVRANDAAGRMVGRGYAELTGYGRSVKPAI